jgi:sugar phosphate isomerase/epimerase
MLQISSRRYFLKTNSEFLLSAIFFSSFTSKKYLPLLSFSTLGCPDWNFDTIINFAAANNYNGIEFRGIQREMDLTKCPPFNSDKAIKSSLKKLNDKNLKAVDLGSSCELHHKETDTRQKNLNEGKRFIDLAQKLNCPYIRVFPNDFPDNQTREETIALIIDGLKYLGDYAADKNVTVLMETHGKVVYAKDIFNIMQQTNHPHVGLVWDAYNMWSVTKESPAAVYSTLKNYIKHAHIKDAKLINGKDEYVFLGEGTSPIFEAVDLLAKNNYKGYYSFEWEKLWHPEIADSATAIADYPKKMKAHFRQMNW